MKIVLLLVVLMVGYFAFREIDRSRNGFDEIEWQGQTFKLNQKYIDWEDYKKSSHQLRASEAPRVESILVAIRIPDAFKSRDSLINDVPKLRFPGYGVLHDGTRTAPDGAELELSEYEIPETGKYRRIVYRHESDGSYRLISDNVVGPKP